MNGFLLDTNIPSETLRPIPEPTVIDWAKFRTDKEDHYISVISLGELRRGATLLAHGSRRARLDRFLESGVAEWFGPRILPVPAKSPTAGAYWVRRGNLADGP